MAFWESQADNNNSYLREAQPDVVKALYQALKIRPKNYFWDPRFRAKLWSGYDHLFDITQLRLPTGLIPYATQLGFNFPEVVSAEIPRGDLQMPDLWSPDGPIILNSYQEEALATALSCPLNRRGLFDHITAAGKTVLMAAFCSVLRNLEVTITVPTVGLLEQTIDELGSMLQEPIGCLGGGKQDFTGRIIVVYDGFLKRYNRSPFVRNLALRTQVLLSDELQTVTKKLYPFISKCTNAYYRYGFSGSFFEEDPARIMAVLGHYGAVITTVTDLDTVEAGRSVPPNFIFIEVRVGDGSKFASYREAYDTCIVENTQANRMMAQQLVKPYEEGKTVLVLVKRVIHCAHFQEQLSQLGVESEIYTGRTSTEERRKMRDQFKRGLLPILIATEQTMGVGINIPRIEVLMNLGGGLSGGKTQQKYGRSIRSFDDKASVLILEPYAVGNKWFEKHSRARLKSAKGYATGKVTLRHFDGSEVTM